MFSRTIIGTATSDANVVNSVLLCVCVCVIMPILTLLLLLLLLAIADGSGDNESILVESTNNELLLCVAIKCYFILNGNFNFHTHASIHFTCAKWLYADFFTFTNRNVSLVPLNCDDTNLPNGVIIQ